MASPVEYYKWLVMQQTRLIKMGIYRKDIAIDGVSPEKLEELLKESESTSYPILTSGNMQQAETHLKELQSRLFRTRDHFRAIQRKLDREIKDATQFVGESRRIEPESSN